jgi:hypothetical protein
MMEAVQQAFVELISCTTTFIHVHMGGGGGGGISPLFFVYPPPPPTVGEMTVFAPD